MEITTEQKRQIAEVASKYWDFKNGETGYESRDVFIEKVVNLTTRMVEKEEVRLKLQKPTVVLRDGSPSSTDTIG